MLPELGGYFIAAIAGGVLSKAIIKEKFMSKGFKIILKDSFVLLILAIVVLVMAAVIEVILSKKLFQGNICEAGHLVIFLALIVLGLIIYHEHHRQKKKRK